MKMNTGLFQPTSSERKDSASVQLLNLHMPCYFQKVFRYEHFDLTCDCTEGKVEFPQTYWSPYGRIGSESRASLSFRFFRFEFGARYCSWS